MKIIDFERKGNIVRFYLGDDDLQEYYGDDWDDAPYDCNAGSVYEQFVSGYIDVAFPFNFAVLEPCNGEINCGYTKEDMRNGIVPCVIAVPPEVLSTAPWQDYKFEYWVGAKKTLAFYFEDPLQKIIDIAELKGHFLISEIAVEGNK